MNVSAAPALNGARVQVPNMPEVWLIYHGMRHHITSPSVYEALFSSAEGILEIESLDQIARGPDLNEGTCLIQKEDGGSIFLLTGSPDEEIRKHNIISYDTFQDFAFDMSKVIRLPNLAVAGIPVGDDIRSAAE
ncbi:hypothetical protein [Methylobacterium tarhaniae]|uniref:hypothetical protein n=1 Tax=Methylobacterium tarhaniae TaxID=1187852 RepID=UPI003D092168